MSQGSHWTAFCLSIAVIGLDLQRGAP
jgi:hypothetical protein